MTLHLIRLPIRLAALSRWAAERGMMHPRGFDEGRALHHLLSETFGKGAVQPFRLLTPPRAGAGNLYGYTTLAAESLCDTARHVALPEHLAVLAPDRLEAKPMPGPWSAGQRLGFDLLTRPTRRLNAEITTPQATYKRGAELDAFVVHGLSAHPEGPPSVPDTDRERVYLDWLAERLGGGATLDRAATRLARFRRGRVARGGKAPEGPEATFHGTLEIADPARFADFLARGVGRHRAYGFGMLLLRAPNRPPPEQ